MQDSGSGPQGSHERVIAWAILVVQLVLLAAIFLLPDGSAWDTPAWLSTCASAVALMGLGVVGLGVIQLGRSVTPLPIPAKDGELRTNGLYRWVRHPVYTGLMALGVGSAIPSGSVLIAVAAAALVAWLRFKAIWEEHRLTARYPGYAAYASSTPRFIPFLPGPRA